MKPSPARNALPAGVNRRVVGITFAALITASANPHAVAGSFDDYFRAVKSDDAATVRALLARGFDPNTPSADGEHGLLICVREPSPKVFAVLMAAKGVRVESRSKLDESPLMLAALKGELAFATQLIAADADVNKTGWTPLHYAATGGHLALLKLLREHHAYIDAASPNASTPLMVAAMYGSLDGVKFLLEEGADASLRNELGLTAADFARRAQRADVVDAIAAAINQARRLPKGSW